MTQTATQTARHAFREGYLVNDGLLESGMIGKLKQSYPSEPIADLRARYEEDGYLFMKGLLPRSDVLDCREAYFRFLGPSGVMQPNSAPVDGIFDPDNKGVNYPSIGAGPFGKEQINPGSFASLAEKAHTEDFYLEFSRHPALREFVSRLKGWGDDTKLLPRSLWRHIKTFRGKGSIKLVASTWRDITCIKGNT